MNWFSAHARDLPWRRTLDPYAVWISEIMLQQTQVKTVIPYYERWLHELPEIRVLAAALPDRVLKLWEGLGYYSRARNLHHAAQLIVTRHAGEVPRAFDAVLALPGIGRYTAGAICSIAFNQPAPILDGNVLRVLTRLFGIRQNPRDKAANEKLWQLATQLVETAAAFPIPYLTSPISHLRFSGPCSALNQSLMELGATVCTPRAPACDACPLRRRCVALAKGLVEQLPNLGPRAVTVARHVHAFVIERRDRVLVRQRPAGGVNARLWEFPHRETAAPTAPADAARALFGDALRRVTPLCVIQHAITRHRITLAASVGELAGPAPRAAGRWVPVAELDQLAFTGAHRKILRAYLGQRQCA